METLARARIEYIFETADMIAARVPDESKEEDQERPSVGGKPLVRHWVPPLY